jgi:PAS domain S-box-containing protein
MAVGDTPIGGERAFDETRSGTPPARHIARIAIVALAYAATGWLGLTIAYDGPYATLAWPPSGIAIAALVRWGTPVAPGVALGAIAANLATGGPIALALAFAVGNTAGPLAVAVALRRLGFDPSFSRQRDVVWFGLATVVGLVIPASGGLLALAARDAASPTLWASWWAGDIAGALTVAPVLLTARDAVRAPVTRRLARVVELAAMATITIGMTAAIFFGDVRLPLTFVLQAPLGWAALRLRTWATTMVTLVVNGIAVVATAINRGPFEIAEGVTHVLLLAGFVSATSLLTLLIRAVLAERDVATAGLTSNSQRLQAALAAGSMGTWTWHVERDRVVWDDSAARLCGGGPRTYETSLAEYLATVHGQDRAAVADALAQVRRGDADYDIEHRVLRADGQVRWLVARGRREDDGAGGSSISIVAIDVTDRRIGEQRQRAAERAAVETEARMGAIVSAAIDAIITVDADGRVVVFNAAAERMFRRSAGDVLGRLVAEIVPADHRDDPNGWLTGLLGGARGDAAEGARPSTPVTVSAVRADGVPIPVEASVSQVGSGGGRLVTIILRDVSERMRGERERERLETQLRQAQKMEAIGTLAGGIAHDFNNLLAALLGNAELVQMDLPSGHPAREAVDDIVTVGHRARDLVSQILAFGRRSDRDRLPVRLDRVVDEAARLLRSSLPAGVELVATAPDDGVTVLGDSAQLHQVLLNLCTNAAQAMPGESGRIEVSVDIVDVDDGIAQSTVGLSPGPHVRLTVSDDGVGMDGATRERIFEPFFTTKPPGQGTGLGLAVVHGIVKGHDGALVVESAPGLGTAVHVYLRAAAVVADPTAPRLTPATPSGRGEHLLWIDDEPTVASVGKRRLERLGYRVTTLTSSEAALDLLRTSPERFDLVITDMTMPILTGLELATRLIVSRPDLPVILSTGNAGTVPDEAARPANICEVLQKPTSEPVLAAAVRRALGPRGDGPRGDAVRSDGERAEA